MSHSFTMEDYVLPSRTRKSYPFPYGMPTDIYMTTQNEGKHHLAVERDGLERGEKTYFVE